MWEEDVPFPTGRVWTGAMPSPQKDHQHLKALPDLVIVRSENRPAKDPKDFHQCFSLQLPANVAPLGLSLAPSVADSDR